MIDIKQLRTHSDWVAQQLQRKQFQLDTQRFAQLEAKRKHTQVNSEQLQAQRKQVAKQVGQWIAQGQSVESAKAKVAEQLQQIDAQLGQAQQQLKACQTQLDAFLYELPNLPDASVPDGRDEQDNQVIMHWGQPQTLAEPIRDHVELGQQLGGLSFEQGSQLAGARFVVMKGTIAHLHRALAQFMIDTHVREHGYTEVNVPVISNESALYGTGQLPKFAADLFQLPFNDSTYYLIPTAEVPQSNLAAQSIVDIEHLPCQWVAHTLCFRSEAGSHGRDTRGMIRQHQFEKVELVQWVHPQRSEQALEALTGHAEAILQALKLPYRKLLLCTGDMTFGAAKTYDLEVWIPSQQTYREISSCSNMTDFQARRMQARYRSDAAQKPQLLHTLNGSGLAVGRTLVAVMENYQQAQGAIAVPEVLQPYMGGMTQITVDGPVYGYPA